MHLHGSIHTRRAEKGSRMNKQRQIEELAKIEGFTGIHAGVVFNAFYNSGGDPEMEPVAEITNPHFDYLNSHDGMQRVIDGLDESSFHKYGRCLQDVAQQFTAGYGLLKATPEQKAEAVLKALDKWEVE